jgi:hypothetical protein
MNADANVSFRETQRFRLFWMYVLTVSEIAFVMIIMWTSRQFVWWLLALIAAFCAVLTAFMASLNLTTEVRDDGVYVRMWPVHRRWRRQAFGDIDSAQARTYDPMGEYLGRVL